MNPPFILKGVLLHGTIYQLWVEPTDELITEMIRNDYAEYQEVLKNTPVTTFIVGTFNQVFSAYKMLRDEMINETTRDGFTATEIPRLP